MKKLVSMIVLAFSLVAFSCNQNMDLYEVVIQNNSSASVSGTISATAEDDKIFTVSSGGLEKIEVSAPYTVSYKNQYGKITGTIDYPSSKIVFDDNPGIPMALRNNIAKKVYIFTGGYIQGENPTTGFEVAASGTLSSIIYTLAPSFIVKDEDGVSARISWTINSSGMTGVINY